MTARNNPAIRPGEELKSGVRVLTAGYNNVNKNSQEAVVCSYEGDGKYKIKMGIGKTTDIMTVHQKHLRIIETSGTSFVVKKSEPELMGSSKSPCLKSKLHIQKLLCSSSLTKNKVSEDAEFIDEFGLGFSSDSVTDRDAEHAPGENSVKKTSRDVNGPSHDFEISPLKAAWSSIASSEQCMSDCDKSNDIKSTNSSVSNISDPYLTSNVKREESDSLIVIKAERSRQRRLSGELPSNLLELKGSSNSYNELNPSDNSETEQITSFDHWVPDYFEEPIDEQVRYDRFDTLWQRNSLPPTSPCSSIRSFEHPQFLADMSRAERRRVWRSTDMMLSPGDIPDTQKKGKKAKSNVQVKNQDVKKKRKAIFKKKQLVELLVSSGSTGHIWVPVQITRVNMSKALPSYDCIAKNPGLYHLPSQQFSSVPQKRLRKLTIDEELVLNNMRVRVGKYKIGDFVEIVNPQYATDSSVLGKKKSSLPKQTGIIRYIGKLNHEKGTWYGLEVMTGNGRHDGTINGVQYFTVKPGMGVFVLANFLNRKLSRLSIEKLGIFDSKGDFVSNSDIRINSRVELRFGGVGIIKYIGAVPSHRGMWYGIELDNPTGKNSGLGIFKCKPMHGIFVRRNRIKTILSQTITLGVISTRFARNIEALSMNDLSTVSRLEKDIKEALNIEETLATEIVNFLRDLGDVTAVLGQDTSDRLRARAGEIKELEIIKDEWDILKYFLLNGDARHEFRVEKLTDPCQKEQVQQNSKWPHQQNSRWSKKQKDLEAIQDWRLRARHALDKHFCLKAVMDKYKKLMQQLQKKRLSIDTESKSEDHRRAPSLTRLSSYQRPKITKDDVAHLRRLVDNATSVGVHKSKLTRPRSILRMFEAQLELDRICKCYYINPECEANDVISQTIVDLETAIKNAKTSYSEMNNNDYSQQTLAGILDLSEALDLLEFLNVKREVDWATSTGAYEDLLRAQDRAKDLIACKGVSIDLTAVEEKIRYCALIRAVEVGIKNGRLKELAAEMTKLRKKGLWIVEYTNAVVKMLEEVSFFHLQQYWKLSQLVIPRARSKVAPYFIITRQKCSQEVAIDAVDVIGNMSRLFSPLNVPYKAQSSWGRSSRSHVEQENLISGRGQRAFSLARNGSVTGRRSRYRRNTLSGNESWSGVKSKKLPPKQNQIGDRAPRSSSLPAWFQPKSAPFRGSVVTRGNFICSWPEEHPKERYSLPNLVVNDEPIFGRNKTRKSYVIRKDGVKFDPIKAARKETEMKVNRLWTV